MGTLVRKEGQGPTGDKVIDLAHDNAGLVHEFYAKVLGRNSIDGRGMTLTSVAHFDKGYNNAYWDGEMMVYGDGDGTTFSPLAGALDVVGHELTHGVTQFTAGLRYNNQSGALNESWSDVMGELIEQWAENRAGFGTVDAAKGADWLIGEDVFTPGKAGDALRSLKAPGTAYPGDPQPGNMRQYKRMTEDFGGVHVNSGIPNKAAYEVAIRIGGEKLAKIWYAALTQYLKPTSSFADAAAATLAAAGKLYGSTGEESQAISDAWKSVGILVKEPAKPVTAAERATAAQPDSAHVDHGGIVPAWLQDGRVDAAERMVLSGIR